jgi:hypothetical protein
VAEHARGGYIPTIKQTARKSDKTHGLKPPSFGALPPPPGRRAFFYAVPAPELPVRLPKVGNQNARSFPEPGHATCKILEADSGTISNTRRNPLAIWTFFIGPGKTRASGDKNMAKIDALFKILKDKGGSDLHLSAGNPPLIRRSGELEPIMSQVLNHEQNKALLYEIMSDSQRKTYETTRDLDFAYEVAELKSRFRANIFMGRLGISAVFRLIPAEILSAEQLGLPPAVLNLTKFKKGLVLVTGPTGSGKSTTLAAMIDHVNKTRKDHILTVEDPIEFVHISQQSLVNQR